MFTVARRSQSYDEALLFQIKTRVKKLKTVARFSQVKFGPNRKLLFRKLFSIMSIFKFH